MGERPGQEAPGEEGDLMAIIGTCSRCHGPVVTPDVWQGTHPPPRNCRDCGAQGKENYGPIIEMVPRPGYYIRDWRFQQQPYYFTHDLVGINTTGTNVSTIGTTYIDQQLALMGGIKQE